jgi:hypothetical protein
MRLDHSLLGIEIIILSSKYKHSIGTKGVIKSIERGRYYRATYAGNKAEGLFEPSDLGFANKPDEQVYK